MRVNIVCGQEDVDLISVKIEIEVGIVVIK